MMSLAFVNYLHVIHDISFDLIADCNLNIIIVLLLPEGMDRGQGYSVVQTGNKWQDH